MANLARKVTVDTPRKNAWCEPVNKPGFVPAGKKPTSVRLATISEAEYKALQPILNGRG